MFNLFGKKKKEAAPPPAAAAQQTGPSVMQSMNQLDSVDNVLAKREAYMNKQIQSLQIQAKEKLAAKDKRSALRLLGQAKQRQAELDKIYQKRDNISTLKLQLEKAGSNKQIIDAFQNANTAIKAAVNRDDVDKIDNIMDEIGENIDGVNEVDDTIARPIGVPMDDDELQAELAALENDINDTELQHQTATTTKTLQSHIDEKQQQKQQQTINNLPPVPAKPVIQTSTATTTQSASSVPASSKKKLTQAEEDELKSLEAMML